MVARRSAKDVFGDAVELAPDLRDEFLRRACGGNCVLRAEVESLLAIHERSSGFLGAPTQCPGVQTARSAGGSPAHASVFPAEGSVIGRYRLGPLLGEGGFGVVFAADQTEPVRRRVALKVIKVGMDTRQVIARFEIERQALAMMDHPHIARALDAGATDTGRPYFVMELVTGEAITTYCDRHAQSLRDRLGMFLQVCSAVQHAHQKGIIHRDLKPGNILVSDQDGRPHVKIVDFGIAKATDHRTEGATVSENWGLLGTPEYMSPEQAAGSADVDTRMDVYALGGLLYELLTGATPFARDRLRAATPAQIERILTDEQPPLPSERPTALRGERAAHLAKHLRGDLDWVVMRCLEKDPDRRYETVNALAVDIERFLRSEPVSARPPSRMYTLRKLLRRHRVAFRAAAAVMFAILLGLAATSYSVVGANRQQARAEAVFAFLKDVLTLGDPARSQGEALAWKVRDLLDQAVQGLDAGALRGQPLAEADVRSTIGMTYLSLGLYEAVDRQFDRAESILVARRGANHPETLRLHAHRMKLLVERGDFETAESFSAWILPLARRTLGPGHPDTLRILARRGIALTRVRRFEDAEACARESLDGLRRIMGDHPDTVEAMCSLGMAYIWLGRFAEAEELGQEGVDISIRILGAEHPQTLHATHLLGLALSKQAKFEEGERWETFTLDARKRVLGPDHSYTLRVMTSLGDTLIRQGRDEEAEILLREAVERYTRTLGASNALTIGAQRTLASSLANQDRDAEAADILREALANAERQHGPLHPDTFYTRRSLGMTLIWIKEFEESERCLKEALRVGRHIHGDDNRQTLATYSWLAKCLMDQGRLAEAEEMATIAVDGFRRKTDSTWDAKHAMTWLAEILKADGRPEQALPVLNDVVQLFSDLSFPAHTNDRLRYAECLVELGHFDEARTQLGETRELLQKSAAPPPGRLEELQKLFDRLEEARRQPAAASPAPTSLIRRLDDLA